MDKYDRTKRWNSARNQCCVLSVMQFISIKERRCKICNDRVTAILYIENNRSVYEIHNLQHYITTANGQTMSFGSAECHLHLTFQDKIRIGTGGSCFWSPIRRTNCGFAKRSGSNDLNEPNKKHKHSIP